MTKRKGIHPIVASVLLIAFTVAIGGVLMTWVSGLTKDTTGEIGNKTSAAISCNVADIDIDDVYVDLAGNMSRVTVRNSGQTDGLQIVSALLTNTRGQNASLNTTLPIVNFSRGNIVQINFNITNILTTCSNFSKVLITTNCAGKSDTFTGTPRC